MGAGLPPLRTYPDEFDAAYGFHLIGATYFMWATLLSRIATTQSFEAKLVPSLGEFGRIHLRLHEH